MNEKSGAGLLPKLTTRREVIASAALAFSGLVLGSSGVLAADGGEISRTAASIHLEPVIKASRKSVYEALTDAKQFDKVIELSGVLKKMKLGTKHAEIGRGLGSSFSLFGGYITGYNVELLSSERIVQAWRAGSWPAGIYSIVKFELVEQGATTKIMFDHTGFPGEEAETLLAGWKAHYFEPLDKLLAR